MTTTEFRELNQTSPQRRRRHFSRWLSGRNLFILGTVAVLAYLIFGPLSILIFSSFRGTDGTLPFESLSPWTLKNYGDVFLSEQTYSVLSNTVVYVLGALSLSFTISIALAWLVERTDMRLRNTVFILVIASLGIPAVISGISWGLLLNPSNGIINVYVRRFLSFIEEGPLNVYSMWGMIFVQAITMVPVTFLLITAAFRAMDSVMEEAATISGAKFRTTVRRITLPVLTPALLSALVYQLVTVVESFDIPLVIGLRARIPVLATHIFQQVRPPNGLPNYGLASTYAILMLVIALLPLLYYNRMIARSERFGTISGKDYRQHRYQLGRARPFALAGVLVFLFVSLGLPVLVLLWTSLQPFVTAPGAAAFEQISLDAYRAIFASDFFVDALRNTLLLGVTTALGTMLLGFAAAWIIVRIKSRWSRVLDVVTFLPHAFPGVIIGLSIALIYLLLPIPVLNTIWIIVIALTTQFLSLSTRLMGAGVAQVQSELEEAASVSGAPQATMLRRILLPLVLPAFLNGALLVFLLSIKNLTLALILYAPDSIVISTLIWTRWDAGNTSETAAIGMIMVIATLALSVMARRASIARVGG